MDDWNFEPTFAPTDEMFTDGAPNAPASEPLREDWPYNFKWGVNGQTEAPSIWRVFGGVDGRPSHRAYLRDQWGRAVSNSGGDILGLALHKPARTTLDGTVLKPSRVNIVTYYNRELPPSISNWFRQMFPQAEIIDNGIDINAMTRESRATVAFDPHQVGEENQIKWLWHPNDGTVVWRTDKNGLPSHGNVISQHWNRERTPVDRTGWIDETGGEHSIEPHAGLPPAQCISDVKAELAKQYPHARIRTPDTQEDFGVMEEFDRPSGTGKLSATWASLVWPIRHTSDGKVCKAHGNLRDSRYAVLDESGTHIPYSAPGRTLHNDPALGASFEADDECSCTQVSATASVLPHRQDRPVDRFSRGGLGGDVSLSVTRVAPNLEFRVAGADMSGAMVALYIPEEVAEKLKIEHEDAEPVERMHITLAYFEDKANERDDWAEVEKVVKRIAEKTPTLTGKIGGYGVFNNPEEGDVLWASPSVDGLAELRDDVVEAVEAAGFEISRAHGWTPHITLQYGFEGKLPKLEGGGIDITFRELAFARGDDKTEHALKQREKVANYQPHAIPFVTDGKMLKIDMQPDEFLRMYPPEHRDYAKAHADLSTGWIVPTDDGLGYGIQGGVGLRPEQPGAHEVVKLLDQETGKPCHFIMDEGSSWSSLPTG